MPRRFFGERKGTGAEYPGWGEPGLFPCPGVQKTGKFYIRGLEHRAGKEFRGRLSSHGAVSLYTVRANSLPGPRQILPDAAESQLVPCKLLIKIENKYSG